MRSFVVIALVLAASAIAAADPAPKPACPPKGAPILQLDVVGTSAAAKTPPTSLALYANGAVTIDRDLADKPAIHELSCLAAPALKMITDDLKVARWTVTRNRIHCMAMPTTATEVRIAGRLVFTERICNGVALDELSAAKLAEIEQLMPGTFHECAGNSATPICTH